MKTLVWSLGVAVLLAAAGRAEEATMTNKTELATFGGGCFWCTEAVFEQTPGVKKVTSGYTGGRIANPTYKQVCGGDTGHAEAIQVEFDPAQTSFEKLLDVFGDAHDPTQLNRQGNDVGTQYRSAVFFHSDAQKKSAEAWKEKLAQSGHYAGPIVTTLEPAGVFYPAEAYHQEYYRNNREQGYCRFIIKPKLEKLGLKH